MVKRLISLLLALLMVLPGLEALAEEEGKTNADIEETVITRDEDDIVLTSNFELIRQVLTSEEFQDLMQLSDFRDILDEIIPRVVLWLVTNRPVTMKILEKLDVPEQEREIIGTVWDSAEKIAKIEIDYWGSEEGAKLRESFDALLANEIFRKVAKGIAETMQSNDIQIILSVLVQKLALNTLDEYVDEDLVREAKKQGFDGTDELLKATGRLLLSVEKSEWARKYLPELLALPEFRAFLQNLLEAHQGNALQEVSDELQNLLQKEEVANYLGKLIKGILELSLDLVKNAGNGKPETKTEETQP